MTKIRKKTLSIKIDYYERKELLHIMQMISSTASLSKNNHDKGAYYTAKYEWSLDYDGYDDYREEEINGQWCRIYKSKMNE